jgi:soluble lytic murein transglycosylase
MPLIIKPFVLFSLLLTLSTFLPNVDAKTSKPLRSGVLSAEDAFVSAKDAASAADSERFARTSAIALAAEGTDPSTVAVKKLNAYLDYWRLRIPLLQARSDTKAPPSSEIMAATESEVRVFLGKHAGTIYADLLRRDWLYVLAKRGNWATFDAQYPLWVLRDEPLLHCWAGYSKVSQDPSTATAIKVRQEYAEALNDVRDIGDSCSQLLEGLLKARAISRNDIWRRLQISLDAGGFNAVKRVEGYFIPTTSEQAAINNARLARQDPAAAAKDVSAIGAAERANAWGIVAANGMRKLHPDSLEWSKEALKTPANYYADDTLAWMARAALRGQDWVTVKACIERMSAELRRDPTWAYWLARALKAENKTETRAEAESLLKSIVSPFNFYGQLAGEELGQLVTLPLRAAPPTEIELNEVERNEGFARALAFYELGLRPEGNREWNFQLRNMNDRQLLAAAEWACKKNILDRCVNTSDRTKLEFDMNQRFVMPFKDELAPITKERDVDLAWVYGLIRQESRFIMDARSSVGASGLMQIMPATGRWIARKMGVNDFRTEQLKERDTNLKFGTFYLKSVLDDLDGSPAMASAAYNAGPGRPRAWRATLTGTVETAIFAEMIPFTETRDYVKKVLSNATLYAALLTGKPQSLKTRLGSVAPKAFSPTELP